jgi:hypothetical protein
MRPARLERRLSDNACMSASASRARVATRGRARALAAAALVLGGAGCSQASAAITPSAEGTTRAAPIAVNIDSAHTGAVIASDFLGLSFETSVLGSPAVVQTAPALATLLRNLGAGVMRIGGVSVDRTQWLGSPEPLAPWSIATITPADLSNLASLMRASGWRLLLGLNLGHVSASAVVEEARTASAVLHSSLAGVMLGNEPDLYTHPPSAPFRSQIGAAALRGPVWGVNEYEGEIFNLRAALSAAGVPAPLYGPDTATPRWLALYADAQATGLQALAQHFYPLDRCSEGRLLKVAATPAGLLSARIARREAQQIAAFMGVAVSHHLPLRVDEANSVACAGQPGTSDTFAGALWALDFSLIAARRGVAGVNFHGGLGPCAAAGGIASPWYSPLCALPGGQLRARPEYYALLVLRSLEGCAFVPATYSASRNISVHALRAPDGSLRIVIDDMEAGPAKRVEAGPGRRSAQAAAVWLALSAGGSYRSASAISLTAPRVQATGEVRLGGSSLASDGSLAAPRSRPLALAAGGGGAGGAFLIRVRPASAEVVTLSP